MFEQNRGNRDDREQRTNPEVGEVLKTALTCPHTGKPLHVGRFIEKHFLTVERDQEGLYVVFVSSYPPEGTPEQGGREEVYRWDENFTFIDSRGLKRYSNGETALYVPNLDVEEVLEKLNKKNRIPPTQYDYQVDSAPLDAIHSDASLPDSVHSTPLNKSALHNGLFYGVQPIDLSSLILSPLPSDKKPHETVD
ncbi:MAG: hypothetical protein ACO3XO_03195 [Bdellovibrionota bacterium]